MASAKHGRQEVQGLQGFVCGGVEGLLGLGSRQPCPTPQNTFEALPAPSINFWQNSLLWVGVDV